MKKPTDRKLEVETEGGGGGGGSDQCSDGGDWGRLGETKDGHVVQTGGWEWIACLWWACLIRFSPIHEYIRYSPSLLKRLAEPIDLSWLLILEM